MPDIGERRLATIRRVSKIEPIEGADKIVKATIDGWELVTQKDNYKPGDLCLYFEIDSFLPVREEFEFLRKGCFKSTTNLGDGFRIKTIRLRGQVSQGLSLPLSDFFQKDENGYFYEIEFNEAPDIGKAERVDIDEGLDVTEYFGVKKYEKPLHTPGSRLGPMHAKGHFPSFVPKTDQERIQNYYSYIMNWMFYDKLEVTEVTNEAMIELLNSGKAENTIDTQYFKSDEKWFKRFRLRLDEEEIKKRIQFEVTMKLDGSSMTVYHNNGTYGVCSRNFDLKRDPDSLFWKTAIESGALAYMVQDGRNLALQGELMGPGVQGNREGLEHHMFFVFDVYDIDKARYMTPEERREYMNSIYEHDPDNDVLDHVPVLAASTFCGGLAVKDFLKMAEIPSIKHNVAEGIVFKSILPSGPSFKAINNEFLLKEKD